MTNYARPDPNTVQGSARLAPTRRKCLENGRSNKVPILFGPRPAQKPGTRRNPRLQGRKTGLRKESQKSHNGNPPQLPSAQGFTAEVLDQHGPCCRASGSRTTLSCASACPWSPRRISARIASGVVRGCGRACAAVHLGADLDPLQAGDERLAAGGGAVPPAHLHGGALAAMICSSAESFLSWRALLPSTATRKTHLPPWTDSLGEAQRGPQPPAVRAPAPANLIASAYCTDSSNPTPSAKKPLGDTLSGRRCAC
jgi:hypothetical protein